MRNCSRKRANNKTEQPLEADLPPLRNLAAYITFCPARGRDVTVENGKKMGRPIVGDEPKNKRVSLRATETTVRKFQECSKTLNKSQTDLLEEMVDSLYNDVHCKK